jgi:flagellar biosynthetic protein FlhB
MPLFDDGDRTEPATPRKRQEAREKGQVARSQDLAAALVLLAACLAVNFWGLPALLRMGALVAGGFHALSPSRPLDVATVVHSVGAGLVLSLQVLAPLALLFLAVAIGANVVQVGFLMSSHPVTPDLGRLGLLKGLSRILSLRGLTRGGFGVLKVVLVGAILAFSLWSELAGPRSRGAALLISGTIPQGAAYALQVAVSMGLKAVVAILVLAILDYAVQRLAHERDLRMTKAELKEELRRMEGDPKIRERRRRVQEQLRYQRMLREVPRADVVVTNPTHVAVAIRYDRSSMAAPRVVAKGEGYIAQRIREAAMENGVAVVERPELARGLYGAVEIGQEIPQEFYKAVAELLAYVYRLAGGARPAARRRPPPAARRQPSLETT